MRIIVSILFIMVGQLILFAKTDSLLISQEEMDMGYSLTYLFIADTSLDYQSMNEKMNLLSDQLNLNVDMQGKVYIKDKNLIALPLDGEDEIYAGNYYPRRFSGDFLSLEYLDYYQGNANSDDKRMIALVCSLTNREEAHKLLEKVQKYSSRAFIFPAKVFLGCMH